LSESGLHGLIHVRYLPRNLSCTSAVGGCHLGCFSRVCSSAEGVRPHMRDTGCLAGRPGCRFASGGGGGLGSTARDEAPTNLACRVQLSASESSGALDSIPCSLVVWRLLLEQGQNSFSAIRGPSGEDSAVVLAQ
jgi:hypothetical protein